VVKDQLQALATGRLTLRGQSPQPLTLTGSLRLNKPLAGIRGQEDIGFTAVWSSEALRTLGIEVEREQAIDELPTYRFNGEDMSVPLALRKTGFETFMVGQQSLIPHPPTPWGTAQMHALMYETA
jgi:hypothetical protein